ncbi:hypothetical protein CUB95_02370 [Prevotella intermedia]|nr:hypothetical protein CUB95_02370 [Prevotella intermedia]
MILRKRLFCVAKPTLLPCKTAAFGMQNNRFYNVLMHSKLCNTYTSEKYLHLYCVLFVHKVMWFSYRTQVRKNRKKSQ